MPVRDPHISSAVEDYAKAIYALEALDAGTVTTTAIAERMGVTAASASGMVRKLCELSLVSHEPYKGVQMTAKGARLALEVLRHHRLLALALAEDLGVPGDRVRDPAEVLDPALSEELGAVIATKLGDPTHHPHG